MTVVGFVTEHMMKVPSEFFLGARWSSISKKHIIFYLVLLYSVRLLVRRTAALAVTLTITFTARTEVNYFICNTWNNSSIFPVLLLKGLINHPNLLYYAIFYLRKFLQWCIYYDIFPWQFFFFWPIKIHGDLGHIWRKVKQQNACGLTKLYHSGLIQI